MEAAQQTPIDPNFTQETGQAKLEPSTSETTARPVESLRSVHTMLEESISEITDEMSSLQQAIREAIDAGDSLRGANLITEELLQRTTRVLDRLRDIDSQSEITEAVYYCKVAEGDLLDIQNNQLQLVQSALQGPDLDSLEGAISTYISNSSSLLGEISHSIASGQTELVSDIRKLIATYLAEVIVPLVEMIKNARETLVMFASRTTDNNGDARAKLGRIRDINEELRYMVPDMVDPVADLVDRQYDATAAYFDKVADKGMHFRLDRVMASVDKLGTGLSSATAE